MAKKKPEKKQPKEKAKKQPATGELNDAQLDHVSGGHAGLDNIQKVLDIIHSMNPSI
jgi:hypothetical protein